MSEKKTLAKISTAQIDRLRGFKLFVSEFKHLPFWAKILLIVEIVIFNLALLLLLGLVVVL